MPDGPSTNPGARKNTDSTFGPPGSAELIFGEDPGVDPTFIRRVWVGDVEPKPPEHRTGQPFFEDVVGGAAVVLESDPSVALTVKR